MASRPATVEDERAATSSRPRARVARPSPRPPRHRLAPSLVLAALFVLAAAYHALQSRMHVTPAIFIDELLYSQLAQSLAAGDGFTVRGEPVFFPAPLAAIVQAPAWVAGSVPTGYALAKAANALVMSAAVFPAYWLARQLVRPSFAVLAAAGTVAAPALLYHSYLLSEALAYPVFLLTFAVMVRALARPSPFSGACVLAVSLLAVATRVQFAVLPLAYVVAVLTRERRVLRRQSLPVVGIAVLGGLALLTGGTLLGPYLGAAHLEYDPGAVLRWSVLTGALLPFAAGLLVVPGAALGLVLLLVKPRSRAEAAFPFLVVTVGLLVFLEIGLVAAGDAERPLERYAIYLVPLVFVSFFGYVERGAPRPRAHAALALALALLALLVPFPTLAGDGFSFDSPTLSAYGMLVAWLGEANAATVFAGVPLVGALVLALRPPTVRRAPGVAAAAAILLFLAGLAGYAGDHAMTKRALRAWSATPPDWLERSGLGPADYLALPGGSPHFGWMLEAWNPRFGRPIRLGVDEPAHDFFGSSRASVRRDGVLLIGGRPAGPRLLVVNDYATQIELEGVVVAKPRAGLTVYRVAPAPLVRSLATGLYADGWAAGEVRYRVWPRDADGGFYRAELELPRGARGRRVTVAVDGGARRTVAVAPGRSLVVTLPVRPSERRDVPSLRITSERGELDDQETPNPRVVSVRVPRLEYLAREDGSGEERSRPRAASSSATRWARIVL